MLNNLLYLKGFYGILQLSNKKREWSTIQIAIDGPAGAGKSVISKIIAQRLNFIYIDTGAMYRAVGLAVVNSGINPKDEGQVLSVLDGINIDISHNENGQIVYLNGSDVTEDIRKPEISVAASNVAVIPQVRMKLVELQRRLASKNDVIMDGRDIGTYVLPSAEAKIFLTASPEDRAQRRHKEMLEKGIECSYDEVLTDIKYRDQNDSSREFAPLKPSNESIIIDTTGNTLEQSVELIYNTILARIN